MTANVYGTRRLNQPFTGIATFGKRAHVADWSTIRADAAIMGAPFDAGTHFRAGARIGPHAVCEASTKVCFGHAGTCDHGDDCTDLGPDVTIVDIGDADIVHTDTEASHANIGTGVRAILDEGALPVVIGGDHSVDIPCIRAFAGPGPIHIHQIDAHLDVVDVRHGVRHGHGNPMRRAADPDHVTEPPHSASATCRRPRKRAATRPARWATTSCLCGRYGGSGSTARSRASRGMCRCAARSTPTASVRRSPPAPEPPRTASSCITRCWRCCAPWRCASQSSASTSRKRRPTTTATARRRASRHGCC